MPVQGGLDRRAERLAIMASVRGTGRWAVRPSVRGTGERAASRELERRKGYSFVGFGASPYTARGSNTFSVSVNRRVIPACLASSPTGMRR